MTAMRNPVPLGPAPAIALAIVTAAALTGIACDNTPSAGPIIGPSAGPSAGDLTGTWTGTGSYPNAPFRLALVQTAASLRGSYSDRLDSSLAVTGTLAAGVMTLAVDFGDGQLHFEGLVEDPRLVRGTMRTSALGNRPFAFTMTR